MTAYSYDPESNLVPVSHDDDLLTYDRNGNMYDKVNTTSIYIYDNQNRTTSTASTSTTGSTE